MKYVIKTGNQLAASLCLFLVVLALPLHAQDRISAESFVATYLGDGKEDTGVSAGRSFSVGFAVKGLGDENSLRFGYRNGVRQFGLSVVMNADFSSSDLEADLETGFDARLYDLDRFPDSQIGPRIGIDYYQDVFSVMGRPFSLGAEILYHQECNVAQSKQTGVFQCVDKKSQWEPSIGLRYTYDVAENSDAVFSWSSQRGVELGLSVYIR